VIIDFPFFEVGMEFKLFFLTLTALVKVTFFYVCDIYKPLPNLKVNENG